MNITATVQQDYIPWKISVIDWEIRTAEERLSFGNEKAFGLCSCVASMAACHGLDVSGEIDAIAELQHSLNLGRENWGVGFSEALGDRLTRNGHLRRLGALYLLRRAVRDFV